MTGSRVLKRLIPSLIAACLCAIAAPVQAVPPAQVRGLDLTAILGVCDQARKIQLEIVGAEPRTFSRLNTIVIDPGHGGVNQGALGVAGIHEKFITLELAYALREDLQKKYPGARIIMTRYWDMSVSLSDRIAFANAQDADLFVSLHYNAASHAKAAGFETYFLASAEATPGSEQVKGQPIATASMEVTGIPQNLSTAPRATTFNEVVVDIQADLARQRQHQDSALFAKLANEGLDRKLTGVNRGVKQANFGVLRGAQMPAIVVESGFVSHPTEGKAILTPSHRAQIVGGLIESIESLDRLLDQRDAPAK